MRGTLVARTIALTAVLLCIAVLVCTGAAVVVLRRDLTTQYEQRALAIARAVAEDPVYARQVVRGRPSTTGVVQVDAERVRRETNALYVVITDDRGIRFSHPDLAEIGRKVSTSPEEALAGREVTTVQRGTLGLSARGKVPLRDESGRVVGEVSVGIDMNQIDADTRQLATVLVSVAVAVLLVGLAGAGLAGRRLGRTTLGLQPDQMADLVREHEAVLRGVTDAIIAVDSRGRVTVTNSQAEAMVGGLPDRGVPLEGSDADPALLELMAEQPAPRGALRVLGNRAVLATRLPVRRGDRDLGQVLILRDRSDLDTLARELEATRALSDALRAQAHEHSNRLHALQGMLHLGRFEEAEGYLDEVAEAGTWLPAVGDAYLAGLVAAKSAVASESGVRLQVDEATYVDGSLVRPLDTIAVVGNLLDNAIRAAARGSRRPRTVTLTLVADGTDLVVHVLDSGDGVPPERVASVFDHGFTDRDVDARDHGIGLSLVRHTVTAHGGEIGLRDPGGPPGSAEHGAVFVARLRAALHPGDEEDLR